MACREQCLRNFQLVSLREHEIQRTMFFVIHDVYGSYQVSWQKLE